MGSTIISYNVNGIRAAIRKGLLEWLKAAQPDILCLQEIKAEASQIPFEAFDALGYNCQWFSAKKKGYSGVAILSKTKPLSAESGVNIPYIDEEGRILVHYYTEFTLINAYFPSGSNPDRQTVKMRFLEDFEKEIPRWEQKGKPLIMLGDFNICHRAIDIHDPIRNANTPGFLHEEREWISELINRGYVDAFRVFHPDEPHQYSWWSYRAGARKNNKGWRIDYAIVSESLRGKLTRCVLLNQTKHSDHCPVLLELEI
ncbi:MAG: exodeoxyribonuclease III [Cryomorphaceae bacterium]|nr:exodeoxyribonuclease III [Cryomorphaceae bacterium]